MSVNRLSDVENGRYQPTWATVQKVADILGISTEAFREDDPAPEE